MISKLNVLQRFRLQTSVSDIQERRMLEEGRRKPRLGVWQLSSVLAISNYYSVLAISNYYRYSRGRQYGVWKAIAQKHAFPKRAYQKARTLEFQKVER